MKRLSKSVLAIFMAALMLMPTVTIFAQTTKSKTNNSSASFDINEFVDGEQGTMDVSFDENGDMSMNFSGMSDKSGIEYNNEDAKINQGDNLKYVGTMKDSNLGLYQVKDSSNIHVVDGYNEGPSELDEYIDAICDQKLMTSQERNSFMTESRNKTLGVQNNAYEANKTSKMRIIKDSNSASGEIVVLDDDAIAVLVYDEDEQPVANVSVTIRYEENGETKVRAVKTGKKGEAIFDKMPGIHFGAIDIQHPDYRLKTVLNVQFEGGEAVEKTVVPLKENDLYLRCADLDGLDLVEYADDIAVSSDELFKQELTYTVMVSVNGDKKLPDSFNLCAENAGETRIIKAFEKTISEYSDEATATYVCKANWVSDEYFKNGDTICYDLDPSANGRSEKSGAKVIDAVATKPSWVNTQFSFLDGIASYKFGKDVPVLGGSTVGLDTFKFPVSFGCTAKGDAFISCNVNVDKDSKVEDMVNASWNPNKAELANDLFRRMQNDVMSKITQFNKGADIFITDPNGPWTKVDSSYNIDVNAIFSAFGHYDKETRRTSMKFGGAFSALGAFGMTWYLLIPLGPATVPGYAGFNASAEGKVAGYITLSVDVTEDEILDRLKSIRIEASEEQQSGITFDLILSLGAYVGLGIHNLASVQGEGNVYMDFGVDLIGSTPKAPGKKGPRFRITGGYSVGVTATLMWFKWHKTFLADRGWVYDSYGLYGNTLPKKSTLQVFNESVENLKNGDNASNNNAYGEYERIDLDASQSPLTKIESNSNEEGTITQYKLNTNSSNAVINDQTKIIDSKTLNGCSPRYLYTDKYVALFRMIPVDGRVKVVYQLMDFQGNLSDVINVIEPNDSLCEVVSYDICLRGERTYISALCANVYALNPDQKARNAVIETYDFKLNDPRPSVHTRGIAFPQDGYVYSNPIMPSEGDVFSNGYFQNDAQTGEVKRFLIGDPDERNQHLNLSVDCNDVSDVIVSAPSAYNHVLAFVLDKQDGDKFTYAGYAGTGPIGSKATKVQGFTVDYKDLTGKSWDGKNPVVQASKVVDGVIYLILGGRVFYIKNDNGKFSAEQIKTAQGKTLVLPEATNAYDIQKGANGSVCITYVRSEFDNDGKCTGSYMYAYRIVKNSKGYSLHGPQEAKIADFEISSFTAVPDSPTGTCIAFFTKPLPEQTTNKKVTDSAELYEWIQTPYSQANVKSVIFTKHYVSGKDTTIPLTVMCKNTGTNHLNEVDLYLYNEKVELMGHQKVPVDFYPGDEILIDLTDTPRPASWKTGVHSIGVRTDIDDPLSPNNETSPDLKDMFVYTFDSSYLVLNAKKRFVNGGEKAFVTIDNVSMVDANAPVIQVVGQFKRKDADDNGQRVIKNIELATNKLSEGEYNDDTLQGFKYNTSFSLEDIWAKYDNSDDILYGVTVKLVPKQVANGTVTGEEAEQLCIDMPASCFFDNPRLNEVVNIEATSNNAHMGTVKGAGVYNVGDTVELKAEPKADYNFIGWFRDDKLVSMDEELCFDVRENVNYVAKFASYRISINDCTIKATNKRIVVKYNGAELKENADYTVKKENGKAIITGINTFKGAKTVTISTPKTVTLSKTSYIYDAKAKKPSVTVKDNLGKTIASTNYTVKYTNNTKVGTATATVTFKNDYNGTLKKTFKINPKNTSNLKLTAKSKGFKASWKKQAAQTTGYQIQYSTSSKFTNAKIVTVSKNTTTSKSITKLSVKKKYYVRIRTYKTVGGTKYYSSWSGSKTVTTKK